MRFLSRLWSWKVILLLALGLRLVGLGLNPVGMSHDDELHNLINAKSLAVAGLNVPGVVAGVLTQKGLCLVGDCIYGELESYGLVPWMRVFPLGMVASKIPYVLASVGLVWMVGKLFENLSKKKEVGMLAGVVVAINPWAIYYGRTAYAYTFCFLLYVLGAYFFTRRRQRGSNLVWGGLAAFGASMFYFGAKAILPLVILWGVVYNLGWLRKNHRFGVVFGLGVVVVMGGYFYLLSNSLAGERLAEVGGGISIGSRLAAFWGFFSPMSLFFSGQRGSDNYFISGQGYFYAMELTFFIWGAAGILRSKTKAWMILALVGIGVLPAAIKTSSASIYSLRTALAYPLMSGIIGWGYYQGASKVGEWGKKWRRVFWGVVIAGYGLSLGYFLLLYWHRLPREQASRWFFQERVVAEYIRRVRGEKEVVVLSSRPDGIFNAYVFYGGFYDKKETIEEVNRSYEEGSFAYGGARFTSDCGEVEEGKVVLVDQVNRVECGLEEGNTPKIANPKDAGGMFNIVGEWLCREYPKQRFPMPKSVLDYKVESLSDEEFCRLWVTNPDNW